MTVVTDDPKKILIRYRSIDVGSDGRKVSVGHSDDSDGTFLRFTNSEGEHMKVRISAEATEALLTLLRERSTAPETGCWVLVEDSAQGIAVGTGETALAGSTAEGGKSQVGEADAP